MQFTVVGQTIGGMLLLKSDSGQPVERPAPLCLRKKKVGKVVETIGRVQDPYYLAVPDSVGLKLVGKTLLPCEAEKR